MVTPECWLCNNRDEDMNKVDKFTSPYKGNFVVWVCNNCREFMKQKKRERAVGRKVRFR